MASEPSEPEVAANQSTATTITLPWLSTSSQPDPASLAQLSPSAGEVTPLIAAPDLSNEPERPEPAPSPASSAASEQAAANNVQADSNASSAAVALPAAAPVPVIPTPPAIDTSAPPLLAEPAPPAPAPAAVEAEIKKTPEPDASVAAVPADDAPKALPAEAEPPPSRPYSPLDSEPESTLPRSSAQIADRIPSNLDTPAPQTPQDISIERGRDLEKIFQNNAEPSAAHENAPTVDATSNNMNIKVSQHSPNLDYELDKAYDALATGQTSMAIEIYKNILSNDASNKGALLGLATTYHRTGQLDKARNLYGQLLAIDPANRDGLNNFLVLLADEAPVQALEKMADLAKRNPNFSPIPAQMAVIYQRLGQSEQALEHMFRAVALAPENMVYRYNLAIMLDKQKKYDEAARLYKQLLEAAGRGIVIPGNLQKIQQRLTFISSNRQ
jgi:tetratricopeptide (TPR) repeat protein